MPSRNPSPSWPDLHARFAAVGCGFAFVIPVFNHPRNIEGVARAALASGAPVVVVDDGSTDETRDRVASLAPAIVVRHEQNQGKGASILSGLARAAEPPVNARFAITIDGDGQHDPDDARRLLAALCHDDKSLPQPCLVLGQRAGMQGRLVPWSSRAGRWFSGFWVWAAGGPWLSDSQSGFRVYPVAETLALGTRARRFEFEVEVLVLARRRGLAIREVPVRVAYDPPGGRVSHFRPWRDFGRNSATFSRLILGRCIPPFARPRGKELPRAGQAR